MLKLGTCFHDNLMFNAKFECLIFNDGVLCGRILYICLNYMLNLRYMLTFSISKRIARKNGSQTVLREIRRPTMFLTFECFE